VAHSSAFWELAVAECIFASRLPGNSLKQLTGRSFP
jgi:hypothetical protein